MKSSIRKLRMIPALAALVLLTASQPVFAGAMGTVTQVEYNASSGNNPILMIELNGDGNVNYRAQQTSPGCGIPAHSIETIKIFLSIAQAALLSGRRTVIYSAKCNDLDYFYDIVMSK
jgi:hypothetical protein